LEAPEGVAQRESRRRGAAGRPNDCLYIAKGTSTLHQLSKPASYLNITALEEIGLGARSRRCGLATGVSSPHTLSIPQYYFEIAAYAQHFRFQTSFH
jgi:hypothetical protein